MNKRDINRVAKMSTEGLSPDLCLRVLINLSVPHLSASDVDEIASSIIQYNEIVLENILESNKSKG